MASSRTFIQFPGVIKGQGFETKCTIRAVKVTDRSSGDFQIIEYHPIEISDSLPPGKYQLEAQGKLIDVVYANGNWLAG